MKESIKRMLLKLKHINKHVHIGKNAKVAINAGFGGYNWIGSNALFAGKLGYASYVGDNCHIIADIGKYCCIAPRVVIVRGKHPTRDWVSTHPAFYSAAKQRGITDVKYVNENKYEELESRTVIGNDVWIGDSALIMNGVTIGDGAIIGAGAVVTKDIPPYAVAVGVPAKVVRYRFGEEEISKLLEIKWWDKPEEWIRENADRFEDIKKFI